jgi:flagellar protein FlaF
MSLQTYQATQNTTENPRQTEYRLFAQVTRALMGACDGERNEVARAVHWNRRLWLALQADCADDANVLNDQTRAGIISLAIWVDKHSRKVLRGEAEIEPLIDVNRTIMEGLAV